MTDNRQTREQVAVRLATAGMDRVRRIAKDQKVSVSDVLRLAIGYGLDAAEKDLGKRKVTL